MADVKKISKLTKVPLEDLHVRFIPVVSVPWEGMKIIDSPHVELFRMYKRHGYKWNYFRNCPYVLERRHRRDIGMARWTEHYIRFYHLPKRFAIYDSIRRKGYNKKFPIEVLKRPFWETRFGYEGLEGPEIWTGAGRAAAMVVLGKNNIPCKWYEDTKPGTGHRGKFGKKLKDMGVWDD